MHEPGSGEGPSLKEISPRIEPRGEVILGNTYPKGLTPDQFASSPDTLWHGSAEPLSYNHNFDIWDNPNERGVSAGYGFYATDRREEAEIFSRVRLNDFSHEAIVAPLLPFNARVFYFRSAENLTDNGHVPVQMVQSYTEFAEGYLAEQYPQGRPTGLYGMVYDNTIDYMEHLKALSSADVPVDLREMLSKAKGATVYGYASGMYTKFMLEQGFDGIIYIEGGDHSSQKSPTSFVFYNPAKVGTQEAWEKSNLEPEKSPSA